MENINNKVRIVKINVSENCFFRCQMCHFWKNKENQKNLDENNYRLFFKDLKTISNDKTLINITGGEPLTKKITYKIISLASKNHYKTTLNTNGWLLTEQNIKKLCDAGLSEICISLDAANEKLHDYIRGVEGSFKKVIKGIHSIKNHYKKKGEKIDVGIICVISKMNLNHIIDLIEFAQKDNNIDTVNLNAIAAPLNEKRIINNKIGNVEWFNHEEFKQLWPTDNVIDTYAKIITKKRQNYKIINGISRLRKQVHYFLNPYRRYHDETCNIIDDFLVDLRGDILICPVIPQSVGNITKEPIYKIFNSSLRKKEIIKAINCNINCHELINCGDLSS